MKSYFYYIEANCENQKLYLASDNHKILYWSKSFRNTKRFKIRHSARKFLNEMFSGFAVKLGSSNPVDELTWAEKLLGKLIERLGSDYKINLSIIRYDIKVDSVKSLDTNISKLYESMSK